MRSDRPGILRRESILLCIALFVWMVAVLGVAGSNRWMSLCTVGESLIDLSVEPPRGPISKDRDRWVIQPVRGRSSVVRLPGVETRPATDYLLALGLAAGPRLTVAAFPSPDGKKVRPFHIPERDRHREYALPVPARLVSDPMQLRLLVSLEDAQIFTGLTLTALRPIRRWIPTALQLAGPLVLALFAWRHRTFVRDYLRDLSPPAAMRSGDLLMGWIVVIFLFIPFRLAPNAQLMDSRYISVVSHTLVTRGALAFPEEFEPLVRDPDHYQFEHASGRSFHFFPNAPAVLNAPIVFAFDLGGVAPMTPAGRYLRRGELQILRFSAALTSALLGVVLFGLARIWLPPALSGLLTLVFAFGSQILSTISRAYWSHAWAVLLLAGALYMILRPTRRDRPGSYVLAATLISWAFFCRPTMALAVVAVSILVAARDRWSAWPFFSTGIVWLFGLIGFTWWERGQWLPSYFLRAHLDSGRLLGRLAESRYPEAVFGTLISPGRGQLIYVPITLGIFIIAWKYRRLLPARGLALVSTVVCIAHWQLVSNFRNWWGGFGFGPRLFSDIVVWLFLLAALGLAGMRSVAPSQIRPAFRRVGIAALVLLALASVFINVRGAFSRDTMRWSGAEGDRLKRGQARYRAMSQKVWDWENPQFLAGMKPPP